MNSSTKKPTTLACVVIAESMKSNNLSDIVRSEKPINTIGTRRRTLEECEAVSKELLDRDVDFKLVEFMLSKTDNGLAEEQAEALLKVLIYLRDLGQWSMHLPEYKKYSGYYEELVKNVVSKISSLPAEEIFKILVSIFPDGLKLVWDERVIPMMVYQVLNSLTDEKAAVISKFFLLYLIEQKKELSHYLNTKEYLKMIEKVISMPSFMTSEEMTSLFMLALASIIGFVCRNDREEDVLQLRELSETMGLKSSFDEMYSNFEKYGGRELSKKYKQAGIW